MRTLNKNKQKMYYALQDKEIPVYELDDDGNIKYMEIDGVMVPIETGDTKLVYNLPVEFNGNIAMSGGESQAAEFGLNLADYSAVLVMDKGEIPITETSLIWYESEPEINDDGTVNQFSADYTVVKLSPSINSDRYALKKVVK